MKIIIGFNNADHSVVRPLLVSYGRVLYANANLSIVIQSNIF